MRSTRSLRTPLRRVSWRCGLVALMLAGLAASTSHAAIDEIDELQQRATWQPPAVADVAAELRLWLDTLDVDPATREEIEAAWSSDEPPRDPHQLLERLVSTVGLVHPPARQLIALCTPSRPSSAGPPEWQVSDELPDLVRNNLSLMYGRWLAQQAYYDESLQQIGELGPQDVVDPAALLFYQGVVHHRLLHKQECLAAISQLLQREDTIPRRYLSVARLMQADIRPLKADSLDEVSRLMEDIQRRLRFGRAGTRVRKEEDEVIAKLDKMIEKLEQQQQQQQQQQGGAAQGNRSNNPAEDSTPLSGTGPGDVDQKRIGNTADWGNLPPKKRQEALQQISKDLPAHYREVIEEYFRRLARDGER